VPPRENLSKRSRGSSSTFTSALGSQLQILGVAATGLRPNVVGDFLKADLVIDEITAHARGAVQIDPRVDTIFEIGGQDAKLHFDPQHPSPRL